MPPPLPQQRSRSLLVTLFGWFMILVGVIGLPISVISACMLIVHSYGTANAGFVDSCVVVLGPFVVLAAGVGLLRRWGWALPCTVGLLAIVILTQAWQLAQGPRETTTFTAASGVKTTVMGSGDNFHSLPIILLCAGALAKLFSRGVREEFQTQPLTPANSASMTPEPTTSNEKLEWRVGHTGRDMMYYEEKVGGTWQRLSVDGEMLMGRAHHVIYFASEETWRNYPEWARHRRAEIIARIKNGFREPDYEYNGG